MSAFFKMRALAPFLLFAFLFAGMAAEAGAKIQSHRALYALKMETTAPGSGITDLKGVMRYAMERTCDGWILGQDVTLRIDMSNGNLVNDHYRFASFETFAGDGYDFFSSDTSNGRTESIRGGAGKDASGGEASFRLPEEKTFPLGDGTLFPIEHMIALIREAEGGKNHVSNMVFDGTEMGGAQRVVTFIAKPVKAGEALVERLGPLVDRTGWTMRLAYFDAERGGAPKVEVEGYQLDNGVSPRILVDYGTFTALMELTSIEAIADPDCP